MSHDERDLAGLEARAEREAAAELASVIVDESDGSVRDADAEEVTSPVELLDRPCTDEERQLINELSRKASRPMSPSTPVTLEHFVKLVTRVNSIKVDERKNHKETSNRIMQALGDKPPAEQFAELRQLIEDGAVKPDDVAEVAKQIRSMKWKVNVIWAVLVLALSAAGGSLVAVAKWLKESGKNELQEQIMLDRSLDHDRRIRAIEDVSNRNAWRIDDHISGHRDRRLTPTDSGSKLPP